MGDCLCAGTPSQYVTSHLGELWLGLKCGVFTSAGWQVTLCDPYGK